MMDWSEQTRIVVTTSRGCEHALAIELAALGFAPLPPDHPEAPRFDAVALDGNLRDAMRINLYSRIGHRVFFELAAFEARSADELYAQTFDLPWELYLRHDRPFRWTSSVADVPGMRDPRFAALRCKDAVADRFVDRLGRRPDSQRQADGAACLHVHWRRTEVHLYLDTTGRPLSMRGYRLNSWLAPVRETLAAAILVEAGFDPLRRRDALLAPMCGSGTFAIEAALMAQNRASGLLREPDSFAFVHLADAPLDVWNDLRNEATAAVRFAPSAWIRATDIEPDAITCTLANARRAGVDRLIYARPCDFRLSALPTPPALVVLNPPYGQRVGSRRALPRLYRALGDWLQFSCANFRTALLLADPALADALTLRPPSRQLPLANGPIDCRLLLYDPHEYAPLPQETQENPAPEETPQAAAAPVSPAPSTATPAADPTP